MLDGRLYPRLRAAVHVDARQPAYSVKLGDEDLQFKGVPNTLLKDVIARFSGRDSLNGICARYPKALAPVVSLLASELQERGMLMLSRTSQDIWEVEDSPVGGSIWNYVLDHVPDPVDAYRRWRTTPILVSGHGLSFRQAVLGLVAAGAGDLLLGLDKPGERCELEEVLSDHAENNERFRFNWAGITDEERPDLLFVRLVDGDPLVQESEWAERARSFAGGRILAGMAGGLGLIKSLSAQGELLPPLFSASSQGAESVMSAYALAALGNMAAFQALNMVIANESPERGKLLSLPANIVVRPDGGLLAFDSVERPNSVRSGAGQSDATPDNARSPHQHEREHWLKLSRPFFGVSLPVLTWEDEVELPVFPIPHRALRVHVGNAAPGKSIRPWAVWPSETTALAIRKALETIADRQGGFTGHAVALNMDDWARRAYLAWAETLAPATLFGSSRWRLSYDDSDDVRFRTLVRLARLYLGDPVAISISMDVNSGAPRSDVHAAGFHRFALGTSALEAAIEALGRTLSGFQLNEPPHVVENGPAIAVAACHLGLTDEVSFQPERLGLVPRMLDHLADRPITGFFVGRFQSMNDDD